MRVYTVLILSAILVVAQDRIAQIAWRTHLIPNAEITIHIKPGPTTDINKIRSLIPKSPVWETDYTKLTEYIKKHFPLVRDVKITRKFPNVLTVQIEEHKLVCRNSKSVTTKSGKIIDYNTSALPNLPFAEGDYSHQELLHILAVTKHLGVKPTKLRYRPTCGWDIELHGIYIRLPLENPEYALKDVLDWLPQQKEQYSILDARTLPRLLCTRKHPKTA